MKSIFITGIAGLLGSNLAYLLRNEFKIYGMDTNPINIKNVKSEIYSLSDIKKLNKNFTEYHIDVVIHCAALVNVDECELNPKKAEQMNVETTENLTKICEELHIKMIFISSDAVFDGRKEDLYNEEDTVSPVSIYGKTKARAESITMQYNKNLVVRTNIYGVNYREKESFGEWIVSSLANKKTLNLFYDILFSPILVNELAKILKLCIEYNISGLYHIAGTGGISKYDFGMFIMKEFKFKDRIINKTSMEYFDFKAQRTRNMMLSNEKIRKDLKIAISTPIQSIKIFKELYDNNYKKSLTLGE